MDFIADFFRWLNEAHGINLSIFYDSYDRGRMLVGLQTTVFMSVVCIVVSILVGMIGAWMLGARSVLVRGSVQVFVQFFRNTPPLVQLAFFYFAVGAVLPTVTDEFGRSVPIFDNLQWAIISISLFAGAFNVEIFRSGIEAVPAATVEAAESLGYSRLQAYRYVVLPLALRICLPALSNNLVNLVKTTTLAYAIAVPELLYASAQVWSEMFNVREMMVVLLIIYVALVAILVWIMSCWERALRIPGYSS